MTVTVDGTLGVTTPQITLAGAGTVVLIPPASGSSTITFPAFNGTALLQAPSGALTLTNTTGGSLVIQPAIGSTTAMTLAFPATSGTAGQVLTSSGGGASYWGAGGGSGNITLGSTSVTNGNSANSLLTHDAANLVQELLLGAGVAGVLGVGVGTANGIAKLDGTGVLPTSQGGTGLSALGTGVSAALAANTNGPNGLVSLNGSGDLPASSSATFGAASTTTGNLALYNSGSAFPLNIQSGANAPGAWTLTLPIGPGTSGQVLQTNGSGVTSWVSAPAAALTVGSTAIATGTTGSILIDTAGILQELLMGIGVAAALAANINGPNGLVALNGAGALPPSSSATFGTASTTTGNISLYNSGSGFPVSIQASSNTAAWTLKLPPDDGNAGQFLQTDGSGNTTWVSATTTPAGATTQVQYNNAGAFGGNVGFTYDGVAIIAMGEANTSTGGVKLYEASVATAVTIAPATGTTAWTLKLPVSSGTDKYVLTTNGSGVSSWGQVDASAAITGVLPVANGGTGLAAAGASGNALVSDGTNWTSGIPAKATNLAGGLVGQIPYQSAANTTAFLAAGTAGQVLQCNGGAAPTWLNGDVTIGTTTVTIGASETSFAGVDEIVVTTDTSDSMGLVTKSYVDAITSPIVRLSPADCATTTDIGASPFSGTPTIDGFTTVAGSRVLVKNQTLPQDDGVYTIGVGPTFNWARSADANQPSELTAGTVFVLNGTTQANTSWIQTDTIVTVGTTPQNWVQQSALVQYTSGTGISVVGTTINNAGVTSWSGGTTGLLPSGLGTGAVTLTGTLAVGNGGTGLSSLGTGVAAALGQPINGANGFMVQSASGGVSASTLTLSGSTSGTIVLQAPAVAGTQTLTLPTSTGSSGQVLQTDGSGNLSWVSAGGTGTVTSIDVSGGSTGLTTSGGAITSSGTITLGGTLIVANGGTGLSTGTSGGIPYFSAATTMASSGVLSANQLMIGGGAGAAPTTTTTGTGVLSALGNATNSANGLVALSASGALPAVASGSFGTGSTTQGDILLYNSTNNNALTITSAATTAPWTLTLPATVGTTGQVLTLTNGTGSTAWQTPASVAGANTEVQYNNSGAFGASAGFTFDGTSSLGLGVVGTSTGTITLNGSTSGTVTVKPAAIAGTWTLTLPADDGTSGQVLSTDGNGITSWATVGSGTVNSGTANQLAYYSATGTAVSGNANATISSGALTLGVASSAAGSLALSGSTSGTVTVNVAAAAGTWTMTLPTTDGNAGEFLQTNGSGVTTWAASASPFSRTEITATAGQTSFAATYTVGYEMVFVNGVLLATSDYTATTGTTIVLGLAANVGDIITVINNG